MKSNWQKPVDVPFDNLGSGTVEGPSDALAILTNGWPDIRGPHFVRARSACRAALDGRKTVEEARQLFEQAVSEARPHH